MRRVILIATVLLLDGLCPAQQPDVRVHLWTLFQLSQVELQPLAKMNVVWGDGSPVKNSTHLFWFVHTVTRWKCPDVPPRRWLRPAIFE